MNSPIAVAAAVLWISVAVRLPTVTRSPTQRRIWVALVALAVAFTLDVPRLAHASPEVAGLGPNGPHLVKHAAVIVAAGAVWEVVRDLGLDLSAAAERRTRRHLITIAAVAAVAAMFTVAPVHDEQLDGLTAAAIGEPTLLVYWAAILTALTAALVGVTRVAAISTRTFPPGRVRTGMAFIGAGALLGLAYCAHKAGFLALATSNAVTPDIDTARAVQNVLKAAAVLGIVIGLLWPAVPRWPLIRHLISYRTYRRLHPLWQAYIEAEPSIAFDDTGRASLRDIELRLYRRVIEIRDGMLAVRPYADARLRNIALHEAKRTGHKDPGHVVEAVWLELARRAKLRGDSLCQDSAPTTAGGTDLDSETYMLTRIAKAWRTVRAIADRVEAHTAVESDGR